MLTSEMERKTIYNKYKRGWVQQKTLDLNRFAESHDYDWRCIMSADCKDRFGPDNDKRCTNCLGYC